MSEILLAIVLSTAKPKPLVCAIAEQPRVEKCEGAAVKGER